MEEVQVVVVGGGVAGLSAARELKRLGIDDICVLEGSDVLGGRIKTIELHGIKCEAGAEFIHGKIENQIVSLLEEEGYALRELVWPNYAYLGKEDLFCHEEEIEEMNFVHQTIDTISQASSFDENETLLQYFTRQGIGSRVLDLADAIYANDWGASASEIGMNEVAFEQRHWHAGEAYLVLQNETLQDSLIAILAKSIPENKILLRAKVTDLSKPGIVQYTTASSVSSIKAKIVILAVSLGARRQISGLDTINLPVANGLRFLLVNKQFWPDDFWNVVCANAVFPEIWLSRHEQGLYLLVGFIMGQRADALLRKGAVTIDGLLNQLDTIFANCSSLKNPATSAKVAFHLVDWNSDSFAQGAYTFPSPGCLQIRQSLVKPHIISANAGSNDRSTTIFFAGEAVNPHLNPCIQGAMLSGIHAAKQACAKLSTMNRRF